MFSNICIIQGDIRTNRIGIIISEMQRHFEKVIVSTWKGEEIKLPNGSYELLLNDPPQKNGVSHRNCQRLSTAVGLQAAKKMGAEFVLKWRTDVLPTNFDLSFLRLLSNENIPNRMSSRLVIPAFRNLSVEPDWFSSFPDHFAFGRLKEMELLWGDEGISYESDFNAPKEMFKGSNIKNIDGKIYYNNEDLSHSYDAHVELYALFKNRVQKLLKKELSHPDIVKDYCYLLNHNKLKLCWFAGNDKFRSVEQALMHPWWTEKKYLKNKFKAVGPGYKTSQIQHFIGLQKSNLIVYKNIYLQNIWYKEYLSSLNATNR